MTFPGLAEALEALLDSLAVDRAHLVGHSIGGMMAQEFAADFPARVASLVGMEIAKEEQLRILGGPG